MDITIALTYLQIELNKLNGRTPRSEISVVAISRAIQILNYLYDQERTTYSQSEYVEVIANIETGIEVGSSLDFIENHEFLQELQIQFLTRMTSYVITVCNLNGILTKAYEKLVKLAEDVSLEAIFPDKSYGKQRKKEVGNYYQWRNKVFAHTAFASPIKKDSEGTQEASAFYYAGTGIHLGKECMSIKGTIQVVWGVEAIQLPELSIVGHHEQVMDYCKKWENMFSKALDKLNKELSQAD